MIYAGFLRRAFAFFIDIFLIIGIYILFFATLIFHLPALLLLLSGQKDFYFVKMILLYIVGTLPFLYIIYFTFFHGFNGSSPGKALFKIKLVTISGEEIGYLKALIRSLASFISALSLFAGYFAMFFDERKRTWHDRIAKTMAVVKE